MPLFVPDDRHLAMVPRWIVSLGLASLVALVFLQVLGFGFVYDDHHVLVGNGFLRKPSDLWLLGSPEAVHRNVLDAFRPVSVAFEMLAYHVLSLHTSLHHALSLALHVVVVLLMERWLATLRAPIRLRWAAAALYGVMAVHAEVVAVVSYREDLLAAAFGIGALVHIESALEAGRPWRAMLGGAILQALAVGAKLSAAPLPAVLLVTHLVRPWQRERQAWPFGFAGLCIGTIAALAQRWWLFGAPAGYAAQPSALGATDWSLSERLAASAQIHLDYVRQLFAPWNLSPEYVDFAASPSDLATVLAVLAFASCWVYALGLALLRRRAIVVWTVACATALALPTANLVAMPNMQAERFLYLTSMPVAVGFAHLLLVVGDRLARYFGHPQAAVAPLLVALIGQGSVAQAATAAYRSDTRLWAIAVRRAPHSARAHAIAGELLVARLREMPPGHARDLLHARARAHCAASAHWAPSAPLSSLCVARLATFERDWPRAHEAFASALARMPVYKDRALLALANVSMDLPGDEPLRWARMSRYLEPAMAAYPYVAEVWAAAGRLHHRRGDPEEAARFYARAATLHPERWDLLVSRVELALDLGDASAAQRLIETAGRRWRGVPDATRGAIRQRLTDARRLFEP